MSSPNDTDTTKFLHFSDAHLGHHQFNSEDRYCDMHKSFRSMIHDAIDENVDFILSSGDLFHYDRVSTKILTKTSKDINILNRNNIPIATICGSDDIRLCRNGLTWFDEAHLDNNLIHLEADLHDTQTLFRRHNGYDHSFSSGYVDLSNIRIFGLQYSKKTSADRIQHVADEIYRINENSEHSPCFTVLLTYFDTIDPDSGTNDDMPYQALDPLRDIVDYIGLGHGHRQYSHEQWIFNAGSLETQMPGLIDCDPGYYFIEVEPDGTFNFERRLSNCRPYHQFEFTVDDYDTHTELEHGLTDQVRREDNSQEHSEPRAPLVDIAINGFLEFNNSRLQRMTHNLLTTMGIHRQMIPKTEPSTLSKYKLQHLIDNELHEVFDIRITDRTNSREIIWRNLFRSIRNVFIGIPLLTIFFLPLLLFRFGKRFFNNYKSDFYRRDFITLVSLDVALSQNLSLFLGYGLIGTVLISLGNIFGLSITDGFASWVTLGTPSGGTGPVKKFSVILGGYGMIGLALLASLIISTHNNIKEEFPQTNKGIMDFWDGIEREEEIHHWEVKWAVLRSLEDIIDKRHIGTPSLHRIWSRL
jgi:DNA repair exonuclease SbcCD nuclease subunit